MDTRIVSFLKESNRGFCAISLRKPLLLIHLSEASRHQAAVGIGVPLFFGNGGGKIASNSS